MINISILGLDQYAVAYYAKNHTQNIAKLYESSEDLINFIAPENFIYHYGVEQNSWNAIVRINAPEKFKPFQDKVAQYILGTLKENSINLSIEFYYYDLCNRYEYINKDYPRFITEANIVHEADEDEIDDSLDEDDCEEHEKSNSEEEIYTGDVFAGNLPDDDENK